MPDIGFTELFLIGVIALIVLGPERLPGAARATGRFIAKMRRQASAVKTELMRELDQDELNSIRKQAQSLKDDVESVGQDMKKSVSDGMKSVESTLADANPGGEPTSPMDDAVKAKS